MSYTTSQVVRVKLPLLNSCREVSLFLFNFKVSEFWLVGGCWAGKLMMWTGPNDANNFTIMGRCRIGHRNDILCVDNSHQFIASGGIDGLLSIWNMMTGTLKYAIELPPPSQGGEIKDFNFDDDGASHSSGYPD